jgi:hypothetical protein
VGEGGRKDRAGRRRRRGESPGREVTRPGEQARASAKEGTDSERGSRGRGR